MKTLGDLIDVVHKINEKQNVSIPYNLHDFIRRLEEIHALVPFETFLRQFNSWNDSND